MAPQQQPTLDAGGSLPDLALALGNATGGLTSAPFLSYFLAVLHKLALGVSLWKLSDVEDPSSFHLIYANPAASEMVGFDLAEQVGNRMVDLFPEIESRGILQLYTEVLRSGQPRDGEEVLYGDGQMAESAFQVKILPLDEVTLCTIYENVTAEKRLEQERLASP